MIVVQSDHFPISTNALFANVAGRGRVKTKRYKEWQSAAGWDCLRKGSISGPFELRLILSRRKRRKGQDLSNLVKCVEDLLVTHGIVEDDSLNEKITLAWGDCPGFYVEIIPYNPL